MKRSGLFVVVFMICLAQLAFAQGGFNFNPYGNGARAAGMGYAFTGVADDATAISWNPAGLTQLMSMEASVIGKLGFGSLSTDYSEFNPTTEVGSSFNLNFASFVIPFKMSDYNLVGGIAYRRIYNLTEKMTMKIDEADFVSEYETDNKGGVDAISPAIGFQLNEMISLGATVNILMGSTDYKETDYYEFGGVVYNDEEYTSSEDYSGTSIELGALVKPSPKISIGAAFKLPYTLTVKSEGEEMGIKFPMFMDFGLAFRASDNLTLAADYRIRPLKNVEVEYAGESMKIFEDIDITGNSFHVGLEYLMAAGDNMMPLRLGYFTNPTTNFDINDDQVTFNGLSAGIGLIMDKIIIDGAFEWVFKTFEGDEENGDPVNYTYNDFRITVGAVIHLGQK
jgi:long-subunit fatty acid transport protein